MWLRGNSRSNLALWVVYKNKAVLLVNTECVRPAAGVVRAAVHRPGGSIARFGSVDRAVGLAVWGLRFSVLTEAGFLSFRLTAVILWSITTLWKNKTWGYLIWKDHLKVRINCCNAKYRLKLIKMLFISFFISIFKSSFQKSCFTNLSTAVWHIGGLYRLWSRGFWDLEELNSPELQDKAIFQEPLSVDTLKDTEWKERK